MSRRRLHVLMALAEAKAIAGSLGKPSKLPGFAYGLNARFCRRGGELRGVPGAICTTCYAMNDFYASWSPVARGHSKRHDGLMHPRWCDAMVTLIKHHCRPPDDFFRWHDSGDIQSPEHLERILEVVERTPEVRHWLPTREYEDVAAVLRRRVGDTFEIAIGDDEAQSGLGAAIRDMQVDGVIPRNLVLRLSAAMIDEEFHLPPEAQHLESWLRTLPTSTVQTAAGHAIAEAKGWIECRAVEARDNHCGPCRACWDARVRNVSYPQH